MATDTAPGIEAQIAAVCEAHIRAAGVAGSYNLVGGPFRVDVVRRDSLAAALRTLEAAKAWADDLREAGFLAQTAMAGRLAAIALHRAIRGDPP